MWASIASFDDLENGTSGCLVDSFTLELGHATTVLVLKHTKRLCSKGVEGQARKSMGGGSHYFKYLEHLTINRVIVKYQKADFASNDEHFW